MRILLDECVPKRFARHLSPHEVLTVNELEWSGKKNGVLLTTMEEAQISVLLTVDKNLQYQQNLGKFQVAVLVLDAQTNRLRDLIPFAPLVLQTLANLTIGQVVVLSLETT